MPDLSVAFELEDDGVLKTVKQQAAQLVMQNGQTPKFFLDTLAATVAYIYGKNISKAQLVDLNNQLEKLNKNLHMNPITVLIDEVHLETGTLKGFKVTEKGESLKLSASSGALDEDSFREYQRKTYEKDIEGKKFKARQNGISVEIIKNHRFLSYEESEKISAYFSPGKSNYVVYSLLEKLNTPGQKVILDIGPGEMAYFVKAMAATEQLTAIGVGIDEYLEKRDDSIFLLRGNVKDVLQSFPDGIFDMITVLNPDRDGRNPDNGPDRIFLDLIKRGIVGSKVKANGWVVIKPFWDATYFNILKLNEGELNFSEMVEKDFRNLFNLGDLQIEGNFIADGGSESYPFFVWQKPQLKDDSKAASAPIAETKFTKGGIDFDPTNMNLQIKRDGKGVPLPLPQQNLEQINIQGLFPVIINITPINAQTLPIFLGQAPKEPAKEIEQVAGT